MQTYEEYCKHIHNECRRLGITQYSIRFTKEEYEKLCKKYEQQKKD